MSEDTNKDQEYFEYLNEVRESGIINMFGAAPLLSAAFEIPIKQAKEILVRWMTLK